MSVILRFRMLILKYVRLTVFMLYGFFNLLLITTSSLQAESINSVGAVRTALLANYGDQPLEDSSATAYYGIMLGTLGIQGDYYSDNDDGFLYNLQFAYHRIVQGGHTSVELECPSKQPYDDCEESLEETKSDLEEHAIYEFLGGNLIFARIFLLHKDDNLVYGGGFGSLQGTVEDKLLNSGNIGGFFWSFKFGGIYELFDSDFIAEVTLDYPHIRSGEFWEDSDSTSIILNLAISIIY